MFFPPAGAGDKKTDAGPGAQESFQFVSVLSSLDSSVVKMYVISIQIGL